MKELLRSFEPVGLSWLTAVLADAGIRSEIFDINWSVALTGGVGFPRRLMVLDEDYDRALAVLEEVKAAGHDI